MSTQQRKKEFEGARDPITLAVIYNRLLTINQEMGITMINTSISPIFAEVHDFSCAICDWSNRIVAQIDGVPSHTASVMEATKAVSREFGDDIHQGDVFVLNDPYLGGTHLPDITIMKPVFHEGALQFIAINRAHHGDVGGIEPGSYAPSARELFHEGIRIPPLRIYRDEKPIMDVVNMIRINTRMPDALWVDMKAQVASCRVAEKRIRELLGKYGVEKTRATIEDIHGYAERRMRTEIEKLADGVYEGESFLDSDGFSDDPDPDQGVDPDQRRRGVGRLRGLGPAGDRLRELAHGEHGDLRLRGVPHHRDHARHPPQRGCLPARAHHGTRGVRGQSPVPGARRLLHPGHGLRDPRGLLDGTREGPARPGAGGLEPVERPHDHRHRPPVERLLRHVRLQRVRGRRRHSRAWTAGTTSATASTSAA